MVPHFGQGTSTVLKHPMVFVGWRFYPARVILKSVGFELRAAAMIFYLSKQMAMQEGLILLERYLLFARYLFGDQGVR